jgi:hypothetical protein
MAEEQGIAMAFNGEPPRARFSASDLAGDCVSTTGAFQLAALLAHFDRVPGEGRIGLLSCVGSDGHVGCALVRGVK